MFIEFEDLSKWYTSFVDENDPNNEKIMGITDETEMSGLRIVSDLERMLNLIGYTLNYKKIDELVVGKAKGWLETTDPTESKEWHNFNYLCQYLRDQNYHDIADTILS